MNLTITFILLTNGKHFFDLILELSQLFEWFLQFIWQVFMLIIEFGDGVSFHALHSDLRINEYLSYLLDEIDLV